MKDCKYKLKVWMANMITLPNQARVQMRFEAYSTQLLRFYIPGQIKNKGVDNALLKIEPEDGYSRVEMYFSLDPTFYLLQDKAATHVMENGLAVSFDKSDLNWCTKCYVYLLLNIYTE